MKGWKPDVEKGKIILFNESNPPNMNVGNQILGKMLIVLNGDNDPETNAFLHEIYPEGIPQVTPRDRKLMKEAIEWPTDEDIEQNFKKVKKHLNSYKKKLKRK